MSIPEKNDSPHKWLKYISEQSWEPELLISGLAIYASLQMPDIFWRLYQHYQFNLQSGSGIFDELLPLLIYAVFTTIAYILTISFITHFVVRAFWVGFIGLLSVYPQGIKYDNLPYSKLYVSQARRKLGSAENMASKLDNVSSLIFSLAFSIVLIMVAVAILYFVFFILYNVFKLILGPAIFETYAEILYFSMSGIGLLYVAAILILNMKRFRNNPKTARWHFYLGWKLNAFLMPLVYKPVQFISLTFLSHLNSRKFFGYYLTLVFAFFGILCFVIVTSLAPNILDARNYFSSRSALHTMDVSNYSQNFDGDKWLTQPVIEKPVISSDFLMVFIPYPKLLDEKLNRFCDREILADSLENFEKRRLMNERNISCAEQFFSLSVNDSLQLSSEWMFSRHPRTGQRGFQTYADISAFSPGKYNLHVNRKIVDKQDSARAEENRPLIFENIIPFWKETR